MKLKGQRQTAIRFDRDDDRLLKLLSERHKLTKSDIVRMAIRAMAENEGVELRKKTA